MLKTFAGNVNLLKKFKEAQRKFSGDLGTSVDMI